MNNPPIIKPKNSILKMLQGPMGMIGPGGIGATGLMALDQSLRNDKTKKNVILGQARAKGLNNPFIPEDPVLSPDSIQKDLNALTSDLKNVKSQKPKKEELINEKEVKEFDDVDDFKSWIKENTTTDATTGELFFIQPISGEKVPLEGNPETNVLLYEVFKEQTGRKGEALEAIKTMNIEELQKTPDFQQTKGTKTTNEFDDKFTKDLQSIRKGMGVPKNEKNTREQIQNLELQAARGMASPRDGSFLGEEARRNAAVMATRAGQLQSQLPEADKKDFYSYRRKDSSVLGFGDKGQNNFTLTPTPLSEREAYELTKDGNYEIAPAELATEVRGDPADQEQEFLRKAILAGRIPMPSGEEQAISTPTKRLEERISSPEETVSQPENLKFKRFTNSTVPGLYARGTKDPLKYQLEVYEDESGDIQYKPGPGLDTVLQDIYKASEYSQRSKEEIESIKEFIGPSSVGPVAAVTDFAERIGLSVTGLGDTIDDTDFGKLRKWAQNFTAKNITTILGESNRTISDADRQRADQIVNVNNNWTSIPKVRNALTELIKIFEEPGRNAEAAYQALMNQAESMGYLNQMLDTERRLYNKRVRGGSGSYAPISSRIFLDEDQAISEDNFNDDFDFEIDLTS
tara:strand:+ start:457 stop:2349 length:1893 start_codon:yes stop_codon:yes gene_type:complete